ncbi:MAG: tight adherence protein [Moorella sp. (in: firmicutes)]|jgi:tight adherence protein C|nr:tight adherence protein [Moorella sp. (in: firmicutes)]
MEVMAINAAVPALPVGFFTGVAVLFFTVYLDLKRRGRFSIFAEMGRSAAAGMGQAGVKEQITGALLPVVLAAYPDDVRETTEKKLVWAGIENLNALEFLAVKLAVAIGALVLGGALSLLFNIPYFWFLLLGVFGYVAPDYWLQGRISARQKEIRRDMLEFSTLLATVIRAGGGDVYGALQQVGRWFGGVLGKEVMLAAHDMASGSRRADALLKMAERCGVDELSQLVQVIIQADRYGTPIAEAISEHAAQMRVLRRYAAEKQAGEAVVKMTLPLLLFIVGPLLFLLIFPAAIQFGQILK